MHRASCIHETLLISHQHRVVEDLQDKLLKSLVVFGQELCDPVVWRYLEQSGCHVDQRLDLTAVGCVLMELDSSVSEFGYENRVNGPVCIVSTVVQRPSVTWSSLRAHFSSVGGRRLQ